MRKIRYAFGTGFTYGLFIILDLSAAWYLLNHIPETFDLGYCSLVLTCLYMLVGLIIGTQKIRRNVELYFETIDKS